MKVLLIKPPLNPLLISASVYEPLELEYLAASICEHTVRILDMRIDLNLVQALDNFKPDIVGLTAYTCDVNTVKKIFTLVKKYDPSIRTVVGGNHATFLPGDFQTGDIDAIFIGYADSSFKEFVNRCEAGNNFNDIPNLCILEGNKYHYTEKRICAVDLNNLPLPARGLTRQYRDKYHDSFRNKVSLLMTSRGCPFRCTFCACWKLMDGKYASRDADSIVDEMKMLDHNGTIVYFSDDNTLSNVKRAWELSDLLKKAGGKWPFHLYARADTVVNHPELFYDLKEAGLFSVTIGIESFRDDELRKINKMTSVDLNNKAIQILKKCKINIIPHFIVRPEYTASDFDELFRYVDYNQLFKPVFAVLTPLPGTALYEETKDGFYLHNYDFFDFAHSVLPTTLARKEFYSCLFNLYKRSYSLSRFLKFQFEHRSIFLNKMDRLMLTDDISFTRLLLMNVVGRRQVIKIKHAYRKES